MKNQLTILQVIIFCLSINTNCIASQNSTFINPTIKNIENTYKRKDYKNLNNLIKKISNKKKLSLARNFFEKKLFDLSKRILSKHSASYEKNYLLYFEIEFLISFVEIAFLNEYEEAQVRLIKLQKLYDSKEVQSKCFFFLGYSYFRQNKIIESIEWFEKASKFSTKFYGQLSQIFLNKIFNIKKNIISHYNVISYPIIINIDGIISEIERNLKIILSNNDQKLIKNISYYNKQFYDYQNLKLLLSEQNKNFLIQLQNKRITEVSYEFSKRYPLLKNIISQQNLDLIYSHISNKTTHPDFLKTLAHAIINVESFFKVNAKSHAGAIGIMQIMPGTAKDSFDYLVEQNKVPSDSKYNVIDVTDNIILGANHICSLIEDLGNNLILIPASYNGGERNAKEWVKTFGYPGHKYPSFVWIELIPFRETREYVKKVIEAFTVYTHILNTEYLQNIVWSLF